MSKHKPYRPWYPWYPEHFLADEKVKMLSTDGELVYRRILDALWLQKKCKIKDNPNIIYNLSCKDFPRDLFDRGYKELEAVEMFEKNSGHITQPRLMRHYLECLERSETGRKNAEKRWEKHSKNN